MIPACGLAARRGRLSHFGADAGAVTAPGRLEPEDCARRDLMVDKRVERNVRAVVFKSVVDAQVGDLPQQLRKNRGNPGDIGPVPPQGRSAVLEERGVGIVRVGLHARWCP